MKNPETNFTPGPWKVNPKAKMHVTTEEGHGVASCGGQFEYVQSCYNALLVAQSPKMYESLLDLIHEFSSDENTRSEAEAIWRARKILAEARGENTNQPSGANSEQ